MTHLGVAIVWCSIQVTLVALVGAVLGTVLRRAGAASRSLITLASLVIIAGLPVLSLVPWPEWWNWADRIQSHEDNASISVADRSTETAASPVDGKATTNASHPGSTPAPPDSLGTLGFFADALMTELRQPTVVHADRRWPLVVSGLFLIGLALGLVRLIVGLHAVRMFHQRSTPVTDPAVITTVEAQRAQLACLRRVEVRESELLETPGTVGWLRPLILLPPEWRSWTEQEKRVVLAHELAHVARGDFLAWLAAQATLVLHFYHPLVHWLVSRLRLEQELSADATAAELVGGRRPYLTTLAELALRQSHRPMIWPARTFLPTQGTFLRRIEMLRDSRQLVTLSAGARVAAVAVLVAVGLLAAGLRSPSSAQPAKQKLSATPAAVGQPGQPLQLDYVPLDAIGVVVVRVSDLARRPEFAPIIAMMNESDPKQTTLGVAPEKIEQATFVMRRAVAGDPAGVTSYPMILRATEPADFKALTDAVAPGATEQKLAGKTYHKSPTSAVCYFRPDERSIVIDREPNLQRLLVTGAKPASPLATSAAWRKVSTSPVAAVVDMSFVRSIAAEQPGRQGPIKLAAFAPLLEETVTAAWGASLGEQLVVQLVATCRSPEGAKAVSGTLSAALTLARNAIGPAREQLLRGPDAMPAEQLETIFAGMAAAEQLLQSAQVTQEEQDVRVQAALQMDAERLAQLTLALQRTRMAAARAQDMNNLKQIALALHNYHDVYQHFPPAIVVGPDGETVHSWRVAILPFIEQQELYSQYRQNEPWDSPNNRKVLEKMPAIYRSLQAPADSTNTSYFALTGTATAFPGKQKVRLADIVDGTSNTLGVAEARREIPWTKPEDIAYDPAGPLPKLGGFAPGGFNAMFLDGSVRFISERIDEKTLRSLISKAGGEVIGELP